MSNSDYEHILNLLNPAIGRSINNITAGINGDIYTTSMSTPRSTTMPKSADTVKAEVKPTPKVIPYTRPIYRPPTGRAGPAKTPLLLPTPTGTASSSQIKAEPANFKAEPANVASAASSQQVKAERASLSPKTSPHYQYRVKQASLTPSRTSPYQLKAESALLEPSAAFYQPRALPGSSAPTASSDQLKTPPTTLAPTTATNPHKTLPNGSAPTTASSSIPPAIDAIRKRLPDTPLLTQVIFGLIDALRQTTTQLASCETQIHTLAAQVATLEAHRLATLAKDDANENVKCYNWCFEAAAIKHQALKTAVGNGNAGVKTEDDGGVEKADMLEKILDMQGSLLAAVEKEGEIRGREVGRMEREIDVMRVGRVNDQDNMDAGGYAPGWDDVKMEVEPDWGMEM